MSEQTTPDHPNRAEDEAEAADRLLHGSSFGAAAAAYAEHRPDYAEAAVQWALAEGKTLEVSGHGTKRGVGRAAQWDLSIDLSDLSGVTQTCPVVLATVSASVVDCGGRA